MAWTHAVTMRATARKSSGLEIARGGKLLLMLNASEWLGLNE
jgi:hypothetical protein